MQRPAGLALLPRGQRHRLGIGGHLRHQRAIGVQHEGSAVEDQFVLAADLVEVDERQSGLRHPRGRDVEALLRLAAPIGRTIRHQQHLGAGLGEALDDVAGPDVLADRDAETNAAKIHRARQRPRREDALFVEHAVIGQVDLEPNRDGAPVEQRIGVVDLAPFLPRQSDEHSRTAVSGLAGEPLAGIAAHILKGRLEDQILGRIAGEKELREHHEVGAQTRRLVPRRAGLGFVAGHVADDGVQLGECEFECLLGHGSDLARRHRHSNHWREFP